MTRGLPELLCPAGDEAALRAAVDCGADAVYLGYKAFGARASATNFDGEALARAVGYAHLYHARVHVTVNTLVKQSELEGVREALQEIADAGADAVIVQDLGVAALARDGFPMLQLHASTQMAIRNASDARFARSFGFARVVLARECSMDDVRQVVRTGVETEVFAHGALCSGVSGRCLMSSMAGGRSGNRGRCAQPCRMRMTMNGREGALLSLRDLCTLYDLPEICGAGVASLKIEGRLKSAEYVAVVTDAYRRALDDIASGTFDAADPKPRERLLQIFNRGGFTRGHLMGAEDAELCASERVSHEGVPVGRVVAVRGQLASVSLCRALNDGDSVQLRDGGDTDLRYSGYDVPAGGVATLRMRPGLSAREGCEVARLGDSKQLAWAREHAPKPIDITMDARFAAGERMLLRLSDGISAVSVYGDTVQRAQSRAATASDVHKQLTKLGETPYRLADKLTVSLEEGLFLPVSALNALRRAGVDALTEKRIADFRGCGDKASVCHSEGQSPEASLCTDGDAPILAVIFSDPALAAALSESGASLLLFEPLDLCADALDAALQKLPAGAWLALPPQTGEATLQSLKAAAQRHRARLGGVMVNSVGQLTLDWGLPVIAGEGVPVTNRLAMDALAKTPARAFVLWPEWTYAEQRALAPLSLPALLKVYGRETLMLLNHCPERAARGLSAGRERCRLCEAPDMACGQRHAELVDAKGYRFPLRRTVMPEGCVLSVLNALPTDLRAYEADRRALGAGMLLRFTVENGEEQLALTALYAALLRGEAAPSAENITAGHWRRGVE